MKTNVILQTNEILSKFKNEKLSFQFYLKINQLEESIKLFIDALQKKIEDLKSQFDIVDKEKNEIKALKFNGKEKSSLTKEEIKIVEDFLNFEKEYNLLLNEDVDFKAPFSLSEFGNSFDQTKEIFCKIDLDILSELLKVKG
jgi:hypothetical protein